jgi:NhaP-type Na+/H+ and K+/H+ antiporter
MVDDGKIKMKGSKPIEKIGKGDKIKVDGTELEVDAHYVLIEHGKTKEMALELFDKKKDKDYQLRYFSDNVERSIEFYELVEIMYNRIEVKKIEW